jgi:methyl-accepting chemotaxis protein
MHRQARKPLRNFFVKKSLQMRIIGQILLVVILSAGLTSVLLALVYNARSQEGNFYYMSKDVRQDIELKSILGLVLPSVLGAQAVSILIGLGIGMFSSRKAAVPIYKFEKWVRQLRDGKLNTRLEFREGGEMKDLTIECNALADTYRRALTEIAAEIDKIQSDNPAESTAASLKRLRDTLARFDFH